MFTKSADLKVFKFYVNMVSIYIFLLLTILIEVNGKKGYVPTLIWTSWEFQGRKNVDYLALNKVRNDLFEAYIMELLGNKKPFIALFLEYDLSTDDFEWKNDDGDNSFPFLNKLTVNSRVDYFRSVESPHETITRLTEKGYNRAEVRPGMKFDIHEGDLLLVEFQKIKDGRPEAMKKHDEQIKEIHRRLARSGKNWISIYTGRNSRRKSFFSDFKKMSPWHVEEQFAEKSTRALSLYRDEFTGFTLITKASLQLFLPSPKNPTIKNLENYLMASAKHSQDGMDFFIWFSNYSVTFHLKELEGNWIIKGAKLLNGNGDTLKLTPRKEDAQLENKCHVQLTELHSEGKPMVKVILSKYKFLQLQLHEEPCKKPYAFEVTLSIICISILSTVICWNKLLGIMDFSRKLKHPTTISISTDSLSRFSSTII